MTTILIVDDSPTEVQAIKGLLEKNGYQTIAASDGQEGVDKAKTRNPDLILMDVVMPGMNGFQATRELSRDPLTANIPVIIVTSKDQDTDRQWGIRQGARDYVTKPFAKSVLLDKIKSTIAA